LVGGGQQFQPAQRTQLAPSEATGSEAEMVTMRGEFVTGGSLVRTTQMCTGGETFEESANLRSAHARVKEKTQPAWH
jgi:hypothetical protein